MESMDRALKPSNGAERRGEKRKSCLPRKREKESKAGWNKRKHNEVNGKGEKEDCRPPCFHSDKGWNGPAAGNSETNNLSLKKGAGRIIQEVHVGKCSSAVKVNRS